LTEPNHGIDSVYPETLEMAPFINIMSEWYAKDCSPDVARLKGARLINMPERGDEPQEFCIRTAPPP